ncbi:hypothetical protein ACIQUG_33300 [Ensifer sp. NPDC090286]|uniref:hypothetical protein n=1 Tax=Ensifer sp. NPDC090286 TaxID=3363991 RepID=UPI00383AD7E0
MLDEAPRAHVVKELMAVRCADRRRRKRVDDAKVALGEQGPAWWGDGAQDFNRRLVKNTPYAGWFAALHEAPTH